MNVFLLDFSWRVCCCVFWFAMLNNCKVCGATTRVCFFLLPFLPFNITLFLFSILYMQNVFKQLSGQLLNLGGSKWSSRENPERNTWGFFFLSQNFSGKRLEDTLAIAIYNLCGLNPYIDVLYWESWNYFFPLFLCLENRIFISGRNRFRTVHSSANWNWEPSQHVRTWSANAGDAVPSGKWHSWGAQGWVGVSLVVSVLPAPSQAQGGPDPARAPASAIIWPVES